MPEGDTVWLVAKHLDDALAGRRAHPHRLPRARAGHRRPRRDAACSSVAPRGKHLLMRVEGGLTIHSHLRMDGAWHLHRPGTRWTGGPDHQVRVVLVDRGVGRDRLPPARSSRSSRPRTRTRAVGHLGPDLLDPAFDRDEALRRLLARPEREIGQALLDQRTSPGSATSTRPRRCSSAASRRGRRWARSPTSGARASTARDAARRPTRRTRRSPRPATRDAATSTGSTAARGRPCRRCGTRDRVGDPGRSAVRPGHVRGARAASPGRRIRRRPAASSRGASGALTRAGRAARVGSRRVRTRARDQPGCPTAPSPPTFDDRDPAGAGRVVGRHPAAAGAAPPGGPLGAGRSRGVRRGARPPVRRLVGVARTGGPAGAARRSCGARATGVRRRREALAALGAGTRRACGSTGRPFTRRGAASSSRRSDEAHALHGLQVG